MFQHYLLFTLPHPFLWDCMSLCVAMRDVPKTFRAYTYIKYLHYLSGTYFEWLKYFLLLVQFTAVILLCFLLVMRLIFDMGEGRQLSTAGNRLTSAKYLIQPTINYHSYISIYVELESLMPSLDTQAAVYIHVCCWLTGHELWPICSGFTDAGNIQHTALQKYGVAGEDVHLVTMAEKMQPALLVTANPAKKARKRLRQRRLRWKRFWIKKDLPESTLVWRFSGGETPGDLLSSWNM